MAAARAEGPVGTPLLLTGAALALLGGLVYLGALCAACRRKGRKKVAPDGVKLVDESLLRQTQLRSLSKSDTKLHELYRLKARDSGSSDPCYESINDRAWTAQGRGPDPDYEAVDMNWKKAAKRDKLGKICVPENLYESVGDIWAGEPRRASTRTTANGLEVYITNL
ncbi:lck-interacting transmembrane adapter 1 [Pitangus sulphuratus]|nr:lck-interacting transmembrane adapter 1 [Pitangus sulphuratus]